MAISRTPRLAHSQKSLIGVAVSPGRPSSSTLQCVHSKSRLVHDQAQETDPKGHQSKTHPLSIHFPGQMIIGMLELFTLSNRNPSLTNQMDSTRHHKQEDCSIYKSVLAKIQSRVNSPHLGPALFLQPRSSARRRSVLLSFPACSSLQTNTKTSNTL